MADTEKTQKVGLIKGVKSEFKKVSWLNKATLVKQTIAVFAVACVLGVIITLLDKAIQYGLQFITSL